MPKRSRSSSLPVFHSLFLSSDPPSLLNAKNSIFRSSLSSPSISPGDSRASGTNTGSDLPEFLESVDIVARRNNKESLVEASVVVEERKKSSASPSKMTSNEVSLTEVEGQPSVPTSRSPPSPPNTVTIDDTNAALLESLGVDPELRASILEMDAETRTEVINDIVRQHRQTQMPRGMSGFMASLMGALGTEGMVGNNFLNDMTMDRTLFSFPTRRSATTAGRHTIEESSEEEKSDEEANCSGEHPLTVEEGSDEGDSMDVEQEDNEEDMEDVHQLLYQDFQNTALGQEQGTEHSLLNMLMVVRNLMENQRNAVEQQVALERLGVNGDIDNLSYEELLDLEERIGKVSKGISEEKAKTVLTPVSHVTAQDGTCTICLDQLLCETTQDGALQVCKLNHCNHLFHERCILGWLKESKKCPVCGEEAICTK